MASHAAVNPIGQIRLRYPGARGLWPRPASADGGGETARNHADSDRELIERILEGDEEAFRRLYGRYRGQVTATVMRILRNREDAEDAVQEIFFKVHRELYRWEPEKARFSTWLYRLAANYAIDRWRRRRCCGELLPETAAPGLEPGAREMRNFAPATLGPAEIFERKEKAAAVRRCVRTLPQGHRRMIVLRHFRGMKLKEIAEAEGVGLSTVKTSLYRAVEHLRLRLRHVKDLWEDRLEESAAAGRA